MMFVITFNRFHNTNLIYCVGETLGINGLHEI